MNHSVATYEVASYLIRSVIIYIIVFCKNISLPEKSKGNILDDIISYTNNLNIISIHFSESIRDRDVKCLHKSLQFMLLKFVFDIFDSFEIMRFSAT